MDSFVLVAHASLTASRTLLQWLLACQNLILDSQDLFCWYKRNKLCLWTMAAAKTAENHGDEWGFTLYLWWLIYSNLKPLTKFISSRKSTEFKDILAWYISQMTMKTIPISTRIAIRHVSFQSIGTSMETETTTWSEFPNGGKAIVEQILASEERSKSKRAELWEWQSEIQVAKLTIWVRAHQEYGRVHQSISSTRIG